MKKLREGRSTGSCMAAGAYASVCLQLEGACPEEVVITAPIGRKLHIPVTPLENGYCRVIKDGGDDPDVTHGCFIDTKVEILDEDGEIQFIGGEGIGTITLEGLKIAPGNPAINPVPRQMTEEAIRKKIGTRAAIVTVTIPNGRQLAKKTFNPRLGIVDGLSILGTTGIVRPMSEEAMKDSLLAELRMYYEQGNRSIVFVLGTTGENALKDTYGNFKCVLQVSNYIGDMLDMAVDMGFETILIGGFAGKLVKVSGGTMNTHSHIADGRIETICTHAALLGASKEVIEKLYHSVTTKKATQILMETGYMGVWKPLVEKAREYCEKRVRNEAKIGMIFLDSDNNILAESENIQTILNEVKA